MYITKDKNGNNFKWNRKGKNRACWVIDNGCVTRSCFNPDDCGTVDPKTQQKNVKGMCRNAFENKCPSIKNDETKMV